MAELAETISKLEQDVEAIRADFSTLFHTRGLNFPQRKSCDTAERGFLFWQRTELAELLTSFKKESTEQTG